nr:30S ribosomal protein S17P [uncultured archaeon]
MNVEMPKQKCTDRNCPFHGKLTVRGRQLTGIIISTRMRRTAVIEFERLHFVSKYERYEKRRTKLKVHNSDCINAKDGDVVTVMECRPLSKTKNFVIIKKTGTERGFMERMKAREISKAKGIRSEKLEAEKEAEKKEEK